MALLRGIGLTDTEAEAYVTLLAGEADAKSLSEASGVPYSKIHTVLSRLIKKSLIAERGADQPFMRQRGFMRDGGLQEAAPLRDGEEHG